MATQDKNQMQAAKNLEASRKQAVEQSAAAVEANSGLSAPSGAALEKAQQAGVAEAVKESAKETYQALTDTLPGAPAARQFTGMDDIMQYAPVLDLDPEPFAAAVSEKADRVLPEEKVAGLLSLERAGKNRTPYVKALMDRLEIDHPGEVTSAGPGYTNDVHPVTDLGGR
jgi:hypothetical protein